MILTPSGDSHGCRNNSILLADKTLSKELKNLKANKLVLREAYDTFPRTVESTITRDGKFLKKVIDELRFWGLAHRKKVIGK